MMADTPERAMAEAVEWLEGARRSMAKKSDGASNVCCAQAIHALIRANDALCLKFIGHKPTRHEDMPHIFGKMVSQQKLGSEERRFEHLLVKAMAGKSGADYGKADFKWSDAEFFVREAEEFIKMAKEYIE
jgi:uncharacterized protein (UPF0332 family)